MIYSETAPVDRGGSLFWFPQKTDAASCGFCESFPNRIDRRGGTCYLSLGKPCPAHTGHRKHSRFVRQERLRIMTTTLKRSGAALVSLVLLAMLALCAGAASSQNVNVKFWKAKSDKESMANTGVDADRTATLTRQANGTYTLTLPVKQVSKMGVTGYLTGLTIGDVTYDGTLTGDFEKDNAVLTIKNLPASVLTGSDVNKAVLVTCNIQMDLSVLGEINTSARMCIWNIK